MSDKCQHNNHKHFLLWLFVFGLSISSCMDCSGQETRTKNAIISLNNSVYQLQNEVSLLKGNSSELRKQNIDLQNQVNELRASVAWLQDNTVQKKKP